MTQHPGVAPQPGPSFRVGIVGGGVAGLATASHLLSRAPGRVAVDIFDSRPVPFGLLRYGVAPDHADGRRVQAEYAPIFDNPRVRFLGNVEVGRDLTRQELVSSYDAVVYATGASADRLLDVPGEDLPGVRSGREFAEWCTGTPGVEPFDLTGVTTVAIIGFGAVAVDLARMLLKDPSALRFTEMPTEVWEHLAKNRVRDVTALVRRGPEDCNIKPAELADLLTLPGVGIRFDKSALDVDTTNLSARLQEDMEIWRAAQAHEVLGAKARLRVRFWTRALDFRGDGHVEGIRIERTRLDRAGRLVSAGQEDHIPAQLVLRATGARGLPIEGVPFDARSGVIPTIEHRVVDASELVQQGEYAVGWVAHGWTSGFGTQRRDGLAVAEAILADVDRHNASIDDYLAVRGVAPVGIDAWRRLDEAERRLGESLGRERTKITDPAELEALITPGAGVGPETGEFEVVPEP